MSFSNREEYLKYLEQKHLALRNNLTKIAIIFFSLLSSLLTCTKKLSLSEVHSLSSFYILVLFVLQLGFVICYNLCPYLYNKVGTSYYYELRTIFHMHYLR